MSGIEDLMIVLLSVNLDYIVIGNRPMRKAVY